MGRRLTITPPAKRPNQITLLSGALNTSPSSQLAPAPLSTQSAGAFYLVSRRVGNVDGAF
jgi:hypothetical protein